MHSGGGEGHHIHQRKDLGVTSHANDKRHLHQVVVSIAKPISFPLSIFFSLSHALLFPFYQVGMRQSREMFHILCMEMMPQRKNWIAALLFLSSWFTQFYYQLLLLCPLHSARQSVYLSSIRFNSEGKDVTSLVLVNDRQFMLDFDAAGYSAAFIDPYAALRSKKPLPTDPEGSKPSPYPSLYPLQNLGSLASFFIFIENSPKAELMWFLQPQNAAYIATPVLCWGP